MYSNRLLCRDNNLCSVTSCFSHKLRWRDMSILLQLWSKWGCNYIKVEIYNSTTKALYLIFIGESIKMTKNFTWRSAKARSEGLTGNFGVKKTTDGAKRRPSGLNIFNETEISEILVLVQGNPALNAAVTTYVLILVAHEVHKITNELVSAFIRFIVRPITGQFHGSNALNGFGNALDSQD